MAINELLRLLIRERRVPYLFVAAISLVVTVMFFVSYKSDFTVGRNALIFFIDKGINFFILLPSLSFALLAMFPSFSTNLKLSMMSYEKDKTLANGKNITKIENFLNQYMAVFYLSLINLVLTLVGFIFFGEIKDSLGPFVVSDIIGAWILSLYLFIYFFIFQAVLLELLMCVKLTYNLILNEFSTHIKKK